MQFVFLFRKSSRKLTPAEDQKRGEEVLAWATKQISEGRALDLRLLGEDHHRIDPEGESHPVQDWPLVFAIFLQAKDFKEAVAIAKSHPGLRYGVSVEVRPWAPPPVPPVKS